MCRYFWAMTKFFNFGSLIILTVLATASIPADAQNLPASVTEPYVAYQSAMEAGDYAAAETAADLAWRAGEAASIDLGTIGLLADNYAQLAHRSGHYSEAVRGYMRSAEILTELDDDPFLIAQTWRLGAQSAFLGDMSSQAGRLADRAGDQLERLPHSEERSAELHRARMIQSYSEWESGSVVGGGSRAQEALDALAYVGAVANSDTANLHFYEGVWHATFRRSLEAAYSFSIASYIWRSLETESSTRMIADAWSNYARRGLADDDRIDLLRRLSESPYRPVDVDPTTIDDGQSWRDDFAAGATIVDAAPTRRRPPVYPADMAMAGIEGVVLMRFDVSETGRTENIRVLYSVPHSSLGESATEAVERWRYEPAIVNGVAVRRVNVETTVEFRMAN